MSTVVFQGQQSFFEPQPLETRTLRLKLSTPKPSFFESIELALDKETSYVHPMTKKLSPSLSCKSLELCTENLGCETGTNMTETPDFFLSSPALEERENPVKSRLVEPRRAKNSQSSNFPPPLTTISGSSSMQVRAHREGGRLVIRAVEATSAGNYFQAERSNGRLRLSVWKDSFDPSEVSEAEGIENEANGEENEGECEAEGNEEGDMNGICVEGGVEMGMGKFHQRPSRCKEGGHGNEGFCNWEPFWVAT
ncbi:hypothetical protein RHSIM_Rhsim04G0204100 [Rhododendron simsii]|uniref:FAF domain-containing protein n=1 Tax=Rhododendron simsii TaxID=118357 RepID=A0A834LN89_RHOSS|nr:hypothetical protein RHSIM_Rhsim04G0204100 [Rhododendron simsii]